MSMLALILWSLYFVIALVLRMILQWRAVRSTGWVVSRNAMGTLEWTLASCVGAALLLSLASPLLVALAPGQGLWRMGSLPAQLPVAIGAYVLGLVTTFVAQLHMGDAWRIGVDPNEQTRLIVHGLFRRVRNPIYTGMLLVSGGIAWLCPTWLAAIGFGLLLSALELQVRLLEEPYLRRVHGSSYLDYAARAGRFLPCVGCMPRSS